MPQSTWAQLVPRKPWLDVPEEMIGEVVPTKPKPFLEEPEPVPVEEPRFEEVRERKNVPQESKKEKKKKNKKNKQKKAEEAALAALQAGEDAAALAAAKEGGNTGGGKKKNKKKKKQSSEESLIPKAQPTRSEVDRYMDQVKEQVAIDMKKAKENKKRNKKKAGTPQQEEEADAAKGLSVVPLAIGGLFIVIVAFAALLQGGMIHL